MALLGAVLLAGQGQAMLLTAAPTPVVAVTPRPAASSALGRRLFVAKSCATCHSHAAVGAVGFQSNDGPDLTQYRNEPAWLRRWLADPDSVRPSSGRSYPAGMPKLDLTAVEIEALIAFLNAPAG
jgi:mono/diheme cytochrome c family protein